MTRDFVEEQSDSRALLHWVERAKQGDVAIYAKCETLHRGVDNFRADAAYQSYLRGLVTLTQRRIGQAGGYGIGYKKGLFHYLATRTAKECR